MIVLAHAEEVTGPHDLLTAWSLDPLVIMAIVAACWWYQAGARALWRSAGWGGVVAPGQVTAFALAVVTVVVAFVSPLDAASEVLFSAHMVQHVLLTLVAAPLFVHAAPLQVVAWGLPARARRTVGRWQGRVRRLLVSPALPGVGLASFTGVFVLWHAPVLYDAALAIEAAHALEHATMLVFALAFWAPVLHPRRTNPGTGVLLLFVSMVVSGVLSALLVFAPTALYAHDNTAAWGLTRLQDQQAAGAVMWVLGGAIYVVSAALTVARWLRRDEKAARRVPRRARERPHGTYAPTETRQ